MCDERSLVRRESTRASKSRRWKPVAWLYGNSTQAEGILPSRSVSGQEAVGSSKTSKEHDKGPKGSLRTQSFSAEDEVREKVSGFVQKIGSVTPREERASSRRIEAWAAGRDRSKFNRSAPRSIAQALDFPGEEGASPSRRGRDQWIWVEVVKLPQGKRRRCRRRRMSNRTSRSSSGSERRSIAFRATTARARAT